MAEYIEREAAISALRLVEVREASINFPPAMLAELKDIPAADVRPVSEIEKIIESLQEQADIYNARAKELLVEEDGQVSQYTWAVSLRETYRRIIKTLEDLIS